MPRKKDPTKGGNRATQAELARVLGLHQTTVSAILSGKVGASFSDETFQRVRKAAREMGYRPNRMARILRHSRSGTIGILHFGTILSHSKTRLSEISRTLLDAGYQPYICDLEVFDDGGRASVYSMLDQRPEAIILCGFADAFDLSLISEISGDEIPIISIGEIALPGIESYLPDREKVFEDATLHLVAQGRKRIAVATRFSSGATFYREGHNLPEAVNGYRRALLRAGLPHDPSLEHVLSKPSIGSDIFGLGYQVGLEILQTMKPLPDAIACHNDLWAIGLMAALRDSGIRIPEDIAITGYGDEFFCSYLTPPLTSFAVPVRRMAVTVANRALQQIGGTVPPEDTHHLFECDLLARASSKVLS